MKRFKIKNKNRKIIAEVFFYLDGFGKYKTKEEIIETIVSETPFIDKIGYAGYKNKKDLKKYLLWINFYSNKKIRKINEKIDEKKYISVINKTINNYFSELVLKKLYIFIFPSFSNFVIKKMDGVTGDVHWYNTISILLFPTKKWKIALKETIAHELAHALSPYYCKNFTLGNMFVFDGIAEHFREYFIGGKRAPWTKAITKKEAILLFKKLRSKLNSKNDKLYREVFFGAGRYPNWSGYTIGYYIVKEYLKKQKKIDWKKIIKTKPEIILKEFMKTYNFF